MQKVIRHIILSITLTGAFLLSCRQKDVHAQQAPFVGTTTKANEKITQGVDAPDTLALALGAYSCNCIADPSKHIKLTLSKARKEYSAKLIYDVRHVQVSGVLQRDTVNFDKVFNIWSFASGKAVYGFRFSKSDSNGIDVALINEDYKKEFASCSDAKEIDFIKH